MGTMANTHLTAPPPITQNPVQRSRAAGDISGSARRVSDIPATVRPQAIINIIRLDAYLNFVKITVSTVGANGCPSPLVPAPLAPVVGS